MVSTKDIVRFLQLGPGAFDHIPDYCRGPAMEAIAHVLTMEQSRLLRSGVYYVVLSDLCEQTKASERLGPDLARQRVESFVTACVASLGTSKPESYAQFVRPIGDAVLFLFSAFNDLYKWWTTSQENLDWHTSESKWDVEPELQELYALHSKTVFHVGEVDYSNRTDPVTVAVNQVFKIEKLFTSGEIGCTDLARVVASPVLHELKLSPQTRVEIVLPGHDQPMMTWLVKHHDANPYDGGAG